MAVELAMRLLLRSLKHDLCEAGWHFKNALEQCRIWHSHGKKELRMSFTLQAIDTTLVESTPALRRTSAGAGPSRERGALSGTGRLCATQQQLQDLRDARRQQVIDEARQRNDGVADETPSQRRRGQHEEDEEQEPALDEGGDWRDQLRRFWPCKKTTCKNYGNFCYFDGIDSPDNHCTIYKEAAIEWAKGIRDGSLTLANPGTSLVFKLMKHKQRTIASNLKGNPFAQASKIKASLTAPAVYHTVNVHNGGQTAGHVVSEPTSSPLRSSQPDFEWIDPAEERAKFFTWLRQRTFWAYRVDDLASIERLFDDRDLRIRSYLTISVEKWLEFGFKEGQWEFFREASKRYKRDN